MEKTLGKVRVKNVKGKTSLSVGTARPNTRMANRGFSVTFVIAGCLLDFHVRLLNSG